MIIENPFIFGRAAEGAYFTDREEDAKRLTANLTHGIHTILISPRRWGKTSLVKKVISEAKRSDISFVFIDIFQCKTEYDFYKTFANEVVNFVEIDSLRERLLDMTQKRLSGELSACSHCAFPCGEAKSFSFKIDLSKI